MNYCSCCKHLVKQDTCTICVNSNVSMVKEEDWCYLIRKDLLWSEMLKEVFEDAYMTHECVANKGTKLVLKLSGENEWFNFYVPYREYERAKALVLEMFPNEKMI